MPPIHAQNDGQMTVKRSWDTSGSTAIHALTWDFWVHPYDSRVGRMWRTDPPLCA